MRADMQQNGALVDTENAGAQSAVTQDVYLKNAALLMAQYQRGKRENPDRFPTQPKSRRTQSTRIVPPSPTATQPMSCPLPPAPILPPPSRPITSAPFLYHNRVSMAVSVVPTYSHPIVVQEEALTSRPSSPSVILSAVPPTLPAAATAFNLSPLNTVAIEQTICAQEKPASQTLPGRGPIATEPNDPKNTAARADPPSSPRYPQTDTCNQPVAISCHSAILHHSDSLPCPLHPDYSPTLAPAASPPAVAINLLPPPRHHSPSASPAPLPAVFVHEAEPPCEDAYTATPPPHSPSPIRPPPLPEPIPAVSPKQSKGVPIHSHREPEGGCPTLLSCATAARNVQDKVSPLGGSSPPPQTRAAARDEAAPGKCLDKINRLQSPSPVAAEAADVIGSGGSSGDQFALTHCPFGNNNPTTTTPLAVTSPHEPSARPSLHDKGSPLKDPRSARRGGKAVQAAHVAVTACQVPASYQVIPVIKPILKPILKPVVAAPVGSGTPVEQKELEVGGVEKEEEAEQPSTREAFSDPAGWNRMCPTCTAALPDFVQDAYELRCEWIFNARADGASSQGDVCVSRCATRTCAEASLGMTYDRYEDAASRALPPQVASPWQVSPLSTMSAAFSVSFDDEGLKLREKWYVVRCMGRIHPDDVCHAAHAYAVSSWRALQQPHHIIA